MISLAWLYSKYFQQEVYGKVCFQILPFGLVSLIRLGKYATIQVPYYNSLGICGRCVCRAYINLPMSTDGG